MSQARKPAPVRSAITAPRKSFRWVCPCRILAVFLMAITLGLITCKCCAAEQLFRFGDAASYPPLIEATRFPSSNESALLAPSAFPRADRSRRLEAAAPRGRLGPRDWTRLSAPRRFHGKPLLSLFNRRLHSRYSSGAWAGIHAGYGDVIWEDKVGRAIMNGAGVQDPDVLYVKLTLRF